MSNIGRQFRISDRIIGTIVEETIKRGKTMFRIALADGESRNPVLGDFAMISAATGEFADEQLLGFAEAATIRDLRELARAGGDATLLRR